jgi:ligand-binding sensor domain-containing protein
MGRCRNRERVNRLPGLLACVCLLLPLFSSAAHASLRDRLLPELQHTAWLGRDGAPSGVTSMAQTDDGMLWIGTEDGLFRFDGVRFSQTDDASGEQYPTDAIDSLYAKPGGGLWIGFGHGTSVALLEDGKVSRYATADARALGTVRSFVEDEEKNLWVAATGRGLCRLAAGEHALRCGEATGFPREMPTALFKDRNGSLWASTKQALFSRPRGSDHFDKALEGFGYLSRIAEGPDGRLWLADLERSVDVVGVDERGAARLQASVEVKWWIMDRHPGRRHKTPAKSGTAWFGEGAGRGCGA